MEKGRKPATSEGCVANQRGLKNGMKKTRDSLQSPCEPALFAEELKVVCLVFF